MAYDGSSIWVTNSSQSTITRLDPASTRIIAMYRVGGGGAGPQGIAFDGVNLWVAATATHLLFKY